MSSITELNRKTAESNIRAAEIEVQVAKRFPLNYLPQLGEATKIDLKIAKKSLDIVALEEKGEYQKAAEERLKLAQIKEKAAHQLTNLQALQQIENGFSGKRKSPCKRKGLKKSKAKKKKSVRFSM